MNSKPKIEFKNKGKQPIFLPSESYQKKGNVTLDLPADKNRKTDVLRILYSGEIDYNLENILVKTLASFGYRFAGSGYDFRKGIRDVELYRKEEEPCLKASAF